MWKVPAEYREIYHKYTGEARFWPKVNVGSPDACWEWMGFRAKGKWPYGQFNHSEGPNAQRVAYYLARGPIPEGMWVLHLCNNPCCCNPNHLELGDAVRNAQYRSECDRGYRPTSGPGAYFGDQNGAHLHPESIKRGEELWSAKLNPAKVVAIRSDREKGLSYRRLGRKYGISHFQAINVCKRISWAHVA
jgi:hypothetical protein